MHNHPWITGLKSFFALVGLLSGFVGALYGIWCVAWPFAPQISLAEQDPGLPFSLPFTVSNKSVLYGIRKAEEICWIYSLVTTGTETTNPIKLTSAGFGMLMEIQDIPPNNFRTFSCEIENTPDSVASGKIKISVDYQEDIFGFLWHRRTTGDVYEWVPTSQGGAWVDRGYFPPDPHFPKNTINNP